MSKRNELPDDCFFDQQTLWSGMAGCATALIMTTTLSIQQSVIQHGCNMEPEALHLMLRKLSEDAANFVETLSKVCHVADLQSLKVKIDDNTDFAHRCSLCKQTTTNCICKLLHLNSAEETSVVKQKLNCVVFDDKAVQAMVIDGQLRSCALADKCEQRSLTPDTDNSTPPSDEIADAEVTLKMKIMQNSDETISDSYKTNSSESTEEYFTAASTISFSPPEPNQEITKAEPEDQIDPISEAWKDLEYELQIDNRNDAPEELPDFPTAIVKPSFSTILEVDEPSENSHSGVKSEQSVLSQIANPKDSPQEKEKIIMSFLDLLLKEIGVDEKKVMTEEKSIETSIDLCKPSIRRKRNLYKTAIKEIKSQSPLGKLRPSNTFIHEIKSESIEQQSQEMFDKSTFVKTSGVDKTREKTHTVEKKASVHKKKSRIGSFNDADYHLPEEVKSKPIVKKIISEFANLGSQHSIANERLPKKLSNPRLFHRIGESSVTHRGPSIAEKLFEKLTENSGITYPKQDSSHKLKLHVAPPDFSKVTKRVSFDRSTDNWSTDAFLAYATQKTRSKSSLRRKSKCTLGEVGPKHNSEKNNVMATFAK